MPLIGLFCALFIPLPVLYYRCKLGRKNGGIIPAVTIAIVLTVAGGLSFEAVFFAELVILGFVLARAAAGEAEILTIAVSPRWQGRGLGRRLMDAVLTKAHGERVESVFLEVDETNRSAIALYRKLGFFEVGGRPDYYRDRSGRTTAALVMRRDLR